MPVPAAAIVVAVVAAVVGSAAEVGMFVVVVAVAAAQERQLTGKGDRQQLERAARRPSVVLLLKTVRCPFMCAGVPIFQN